MNMRDKMPTVAEFIDFLRGNLGREVVDAQIRKGMQGIPVFWASENGHEVGTRIDEPPPDKVQTYEHLGPVAGRAAPVQLPAKTPQPDH